MKHIKIGKTLVILVGPSGSGKSTFTQNFDPREVVSSDDIRYDLLGDLRRQDRNAEVFAEFHHRIRTKLKLGMRVVADATHLRDADRKTVAKIGKEEFAEVVYVVINRPVSDKLATGGWRNDVKIKGMTLIEKHEDIFNSNLKRILNGDGLADVVIDTRTPDDEFKIVHALPRSPKLVISFLMQHGFFKVRVVGDVHGDKKGLMDALDAPDDTFFIFLGDVVDYGKHTLETAHIVSDMVRSGKAIMLRGNHEKKITNFIVGTQNGKFRGRLSHGNTITVEQLESMTPDDRASWESMFLGLMDISPDHIQIGHEWMFAHGAVDPWMWGDSIFRLPKNSKLESMAMFGQTTGEFVDGYPVRLDEWVDELAEHQTAVVGHSIHSVEKVTVMNGANLGTAIMLDTGASKSKDDVAGHLSWADLSIVPDENEKPVLTFKSFGESS